MSPLALRIGIACTIVGLCACAPPGKVKLEDQNEFGRVRSAVWFEFKQTLDGKGADQFHQFWLTDRAGLCNDMKDAAPAIALAWKETIGSLATNADELTQCTATLAYWDALATFGAPIYEKGLNTLVFDFRVPGRQRDVPPEVETYEVGFDVQDPFFWGTLTYLQDNPFEDVVKEFDCADYDWYEAPDRVLPDEYEVYPMGGGTADVEDKGDSKKKVTFEGDLVDESGADAGAIEGKGKFSYCEIEYDGYLDFFVEPPPLAGTTPTETETETETTDNTL